MKVITIYTFKGGVGKTTTAINLTAGLACLGKKVLLIDIDPQANLTSFFLEDYQGQTLSDCLLEPSKVGDVIQNTNNELIDIIPASMQLIITNDELTLSKGFKQLKLHNLLKSLRNEYDYCIIDCPPHYSELVVNALYITDEAIIPLRSDANSRQAFDIVQKTIDGFNEEFDRNIKYTGLFAGKERNNIDSVLYDDLLQHGLIYETAIRFQGKPVKVSLRDKAPLFESKSGVAEDYTCFIDEFLGGTKNEKSC